MNCQANNAIYLDNHWRSTHTCFMQPRLIHPVRVTLANPDISAAEINPRWGETEGEIKYFPPITVLAQVKLYALDRIEAAANGFTLKGDGYLLVYPIIAELIEVNARISEMDGKSVEYYVTEWMPVAHYETASLWKVFFKGKDKGTL